MKRFIPVCVIVVAMLVGMVLGACGTNTVNANTTSKFELVDLNQHSILPGFLVDSETGVNYIVVYGNSGMAITPRLTADGELYVTPKN